MRLVLDARTATFAALIDYAGLFPPAGQSMPEAVHDYRVLRKGDHGWVSGRFLCRASQLADLASVATATFQAGESPWEVGVIFDRSPGESAALAVDFQSEMDPAITIAGAEARLTEPAPAAIESLLDTMLSVASDVVPFIEVDRGTPITSQVDLVSKALGARRRVGGVKLRCGGATRDLFPTSGEVAEFIVAATDRSLPFKATAGLHQPIRHLDEGLGIERHGFLNILMAAALAEGGMDANGVEAVIADTDKDAFSVSALFASWRGNEIPGSALRRVRRDGFVAYGSCDFEEPTAALEDLGFLGGGA
jgi:hypothetical protein